MALTDEFKEAEVLVKKLTRMPATTELLDLYALYKQATAGDVQGKRPGMLDMKGRAKYDAWASQKSVSREDAMRAYVALVTQLRAKYA
jgi:diazepam-binding inhibitor (GABA receptor modulator, acyl-CoA-binding protein)